MMCSREELLRYVERVITEDQRTERLADLDDAIAELENLVDVDFDIMPDGIQPEEFMIAWNEFMDKKEAARN